MLISGRTQPRLLRLKSAALWSVAGRLQDVTWWEKVTMWPLVLVGFGFYPAPILDLLDAAVKTLLEGLP